MNGWVLGDEFRGEQEIEVGDAHCAQCRIPLSAGVSLAGWLLGHGVEGPLECGRDEWCGTLDRDGCGPAAGNARKWPGDEEAVPGAEAPGACGMQVEGAHGGDAGVRCGCCCSGFCDVSGAPGAVDRDGAFATSLQSSRKGEQTGRAAAAAGAAYWHKAETLDDACNEFAVKGLGDEDVNAEVSVAIGGQQEGVVPERVQVGSCSPVG